MSAPAFKEESVECLAGDAGDPAEIKAEPALANILLIRNSRLSVIPLSRDEFETILRIAG